MISRVEPHRGRMTRRGTDPPSRGLNQNHSLALDIFDHDLTEKAISSLFPFKMVQLSNKLKYDTLANSQEQEESSKAQPLRSQSIQQKPTGCSPAQSQNSWTATYFSKSQLNNFTSLATLHQESKLNRLLDANDVQFLFTSSEAPVAELRITARRIHDTYYQELIRRKSPSQSHLDHSDHENQSSQSLDDLFVLFESPSFVETLSEKSHPFDVYTIPLYSFMMGSRNSELPSSMLFLPEVTQNCSPVRRLSPWKFRLFSPSMVLYCQSAIWNHFLSSMETLRKSLEIHSDVIFERLSTAQQFVLYFQNYEAKQQRQSAIDLYVKCDFV